MTTLVWHAGTVHTGHPPLVSGGDRGLLLGEGVFTTCALVAGRPFALRRHLARLTSDAAALDLPAPPSEEVHEAVAVLGARLPGAHGRLRITWTAGVGPNHQQTDGEECAGTLLVAATAGAAGQHRESTQRAVLLPWPHNERSPLSGVKSISFGANAYGLAQARRQGADEGLLANTRAELCEGTTSNVVLEQDGELFTPPVDSGCLPGITRQLLLEWAAEAGLPMRERTVPVRELATAPHAALTSSLRGVMPLSAVDGRGLAIGPLTRALAELYETRRRACPDP